MKLVYLIVHFVICLISSANSAHISSVDGLSSGFTFIILIHISPNFGISSLRSGSKSPFLILVIIWYSDPLKGYTPVISTYQTHPRDQTSHFSLYDFPSTISGAIVLGVPINVDASSFSIDLAMPKSPSFKSRSESRNPSSSFTFLCMIWCSCRYLIA